MKRNISSYIGGLDPRHGLVVPDSYRCLICRENEALAGRDNCKDGFCVSVAIAKAQEKRKAKEELARKYLGPDTFAIWKKAQDEYWKQVKLNKAIEPAVRRDKQEVQDKVLLGGHIMESPQAEALLADR